MFIPPEVMGAHIGPPRSHTTGRRQSLPFRAATAMFGHLGVEWNLLELNDVERAQLAEVIAIHKRFRSLLHGGDSVRFDTDPSSAAHGVYSADRSEALISFAQLVTAESLVPAPLRMPGLDPAKRYRIERIGLPGGGAERGPSRSSPQWLRVGAEMTGRELAVLGLQLPVMNPESALLILLMG